MRLFLVQHGEAKAESEDPERPLTDRGAADVAGVARYAIDHLGVGPARVVHSGKTRARQTADIWHGALGADVETAEGLALNDDPAVWAERVTGAEDDVMLVGHLPHLERLAALLTTGDAGRAVVRFRPGAIVGLERTDAGWVVCLALPPG